jgi:predicted DNA-binding protein
MDSTLLEPMQLLSQSGESANMSISRAAPTPTTTGMTKKVRQMPFPVRLSPDLRRRLEALAKADRRTLSNYILMVLERHVEAEERGSAADNSRSSSND